MTSNSNIRQTSH